MSLKIFVFALLVALSTSYTEEGNVLVLTDADFPGIFKEFSHILIQFYAPWCGHCKKLAPIYTEVADKLKEEGSIARVAKIDSTENSKSAGTYGVKGYPTLIFFLNGTKVEYNGQRTKDTMFNWLVKRTREPVSQITAEKYKELADAQGVSVVYHGELSKAEGAQILSKLALADDFNTYYWGTDLGKPQGSVQLIRDFDDSITFDSLKEGVQDWIVKNQRPLLVPFDERTIGDMFSSKKLGAVLFNGEDSTELYGNFAEAAKQYAASNGKPLIFAEINGKNEHLQNFAKYIKIDHKSTPLVIIDAGSQTKFVLQQEATKQNILTFLNDHKNAKVGITEQVKVARKQEKKEQVAGEQL